MLRSALFGAITVTFIREIMCQWWLSTLISHQVSRDILYSRCLRLWWLLLSVFFAPNSYCRLIDELPTSTAKFILANGDRMDQKLQSSKRLEKHYLSPDLARAWTLTWHVNERVFTGTSAFLWFFRSLPSVSCKVSRRVFLFIGSKGSFFGNFSLDYKVVIEKRSRKTNESSCGTENYRTKLTFDKLRSCTWICELENKL